MAYFALLWKARTIEKYRLNYEREKLNSIRITQTQNPKQTFYQRICQCNLNTRKRLSNAFLRHYPRGSAVYNFFYYLRTDLTFPNFVMKSVIGFVGGIILTYLCFMFFVFQLSISLMHATFMSSIIGVLLTLGLAFSFRVRCMVFLLIPQFFSRVGRYTLTCYALVLILTGPATNTLKNSEVLSESLACCQEQIKNSIHQVNESMSSPFHCMNDSIRAMIQSIKLLAHKMKTICIRVHRLVFSITHTLQSSFHWLSTTVQTCNKKLGTPYQRCTKAVNNAITECQVTLGPKLSWVCDVAQVTKLVCSPIKHLKSFCHVIDFANKNILVVINGKLKSFYERLNLMLYLEVNVHHSFSFNSNSSKSASQVAAGIVTEIRNRADPLLTWLSWSSCVTSLSLLLILFRAKYYQFMFETRPRFDNRYITKELRDLDLKRLRHRKETILPLNRREEVRYIKTTSFRLLASEKIHISRSAVSMAYTTFKLMIHMVADYSLYWVLMTIRYHGRFQTPAQPGLRNTGMYVSGSGFLSKIFRSVIRSIDLPLTAQTPSPITCLPAPYPPDFQRYSQIGVLVFLLWFSALMEPYGLRLRHVIMGLYRPERAKARAVWLFNRIQKTRGSFMKFARRKLHREYKYSSESKHTFRLWLYNHVPFSWLRYLLGIKAEKPHCFLCGIIEDCDEMEDELTHCLTPTCPGTYCIRCFADIGQLCTICLSPADYGDMSDVSLEKGSSDDEDNSEESSFGRSNPTFKSQKSNLRSNRSRWSLFPRMGKKGRHRQDIESRPILYESDAMGVKDSSNTKTEENSVKNYNIVSRALMIRHRKYSELDSIGARRKEIMTLHQDGLYFVCWTKQHISRNDSYCIMMSEGYHGTCNKHCFNISRKNSKNKSLDTSLDSDKNATSTVTTDNSITKLLRRFRCLRRYSLMSRSTQRMSKKSRKALTIRSNSSKNSRSSSRKRRKKGYWSERNLNSTGKTLSGNCKCNSNIMSTFKINNTRSLDAIDSKRHKICSKHLVPKCRSKSEPGFLNKVAQILRNARRRRFEVNAAMKFKKLSKKTAMDNDNNDDNEKEQVSPNKSGAKDEKSEVLPIKNKENDEETPVKLADSKKNSQKTEKLLNLLGVYCKTTQMFTQPINFNKFFKKTEVPEQHAKTNYKRRKKEKPVKEKTSADVKKRSDKEAARKYRLSTYLSELDWKRKKCKFRNKCGINDDSIEVQDASHCLEKDGPNTKGDVNKKVCMANKTLWLKRGLYSKVYKKWSPNDKLQISSSEGPVVLAVGTIDASMTNNKGSNLSVNFRSHQSCQRVLDFTLASESDEYDISRVIDYYRSLGHHDFDGSDMLLRANEGYLEQIVSEQKKKLASGGDRPSMERPGSTMHQERSVETVNLKKSSGSRKEKKLKQIYTECKSKHSLKRKSTRQAFTETTAVKLKAAYSETAKDLSPELDLMRKSKSRAVCTEIERKKSISFSDAGKGSKALDIKPQTSKHSKTEVTKPETDKSPSIFRKAITTVKGWFSKSEKKKKKQDKQTKVDAEAVVRPVVQTVSCQYTVSEPKYQIQNTTAHMCQMKEAEQCISHELLQDAEVDAGREVCTCATQFTTHSKNVGTYYKCKIHRNANIAVRDAGTIHYNAVKNTRRDVATMHRNCCKMMQNTCIQCQLPAVTKSPLMRRPPLEDNSVDTFDTTDTMETLSSIRSDDDTAKTDTTVYCLKCDGEAGRNKLQRCKVNVVTKSNRGTCTDPKKIRDASTVTSDWWSPMSDRRTQKNKVSYLNLRSRKKTFREKGMATDGRVVKFKSNAQIIPSLHTDVLSPSRYLLESQRYYNELFNSKFYSPHLLPINSYQPRDGERVHRQPHPNRHQARRWRNYRAKRLDDSHSPRKMILPREHCNEELWLAENVHSKRQTNAGNKKQRTNKKLNIPKKSRNSYRHVTDRSIIDVKTGQVNLVSRRVASSEGLSLDSRLRNTNST